MGIPDAQLVDRLRRIYEAMNDGDFDAVVERAHPDMTLTRPGGQGVLRGSEAIRRWLEPDAFESQVLEPVEFEVAGNRVLSLVRATLRGAGSGIEIEAEAWTVWTFDDEGTVTRAEVFLAREEDRARRALRGD
jgi:ketosteroid isomerase-like protein